MSTVGCASTIGSRGEGSQRSSSPGSTAPAASSLTAQTNGVGSPTWAECQTSQLSLAEGAHAGAGGASYTTYYLANIGGENCTLSGYPAVDVIDEDGNIAQRQAVDDPGPGTTSDGQVTVVALSPDDRAMFVLANVDTVPNPDCAQPYRGVLLRVYPPDAITPLTQPGEYAVCDLSVGPLRVASDVPPSTTASDTRYATSPGG
jgi:hypothetical protein